MKTNENAFSIKKQPEKSVSREVISFSKESSEGDQTSIKDEKSFRSKGQRPDKEPSTNNLSGYSKQNWKNPSYSFVVDWQMLESSE